MSDVLRELVATARKLTEIGLVTGAGGNVSLRDDRGMWISPSGFSLADAGANDYPCIDVETGESIHAPHRPSSEMLMHLAIYRVRPEVRAVIHTHPKNAIALTAAGHDLRAIYPDYHVYLGANVPHLDYVTVTTPELAAAVEGPFRASDCFGMILRNHGAITVGTSVVEAYFRTLAIEEQATIQWHALQVGEPTYLSQQECDKLDRLDSEAYRRELLE